MDLQINNKPAIASGSVMLPPNVKSGISIPGGVINLIFKLDGEEGYSLTNWELTITAKANPLGIALDIPLKAADGSDIKLSMVVYTIGDIEKIYRVIHYVLYK